MVELLDAGASDTDFADEDQVYYVQGGWESHGGWTRAQHLNVIMNQKNQRHDDHVFWELLSEMACSACDKWVASSASYNGGSEWLLWLTGEYVLRPYNHVIFPPYVCEPHRPRPHLRALWKAFEFLCLTAGEWLRENHDTRCLFGVLSRLGRDLLGSKDGSPSFFGQHCQYAPFLDRSKPRFRFFFRQFMRFVILPGFRSTNPDPPPGVPVDRTVQWFHHERWVSACFFFLDSIDDDDPDVVHSNENIDLYTRLFTSNVYQAVWSSRALQRRWRDSLRHNHALRLAALRHNDGMDVVRRKDRRVLLDIWVRLEPLEALVARVPGWIEWLRARHPAVVVQGRKERLLAELEDVLAQHQRRERVLQEISTWSGCCSVVAL